MAQGIRLNRSVTCLNMAGTSLKGKVGEEVAGALACNKALVAVNLSFTGVGGAAVGCLAKVSLNVREYR